MEIYFKYLEAIIKHQVKQLYLGLYLNESPIQVLEEDLVCYPQMKENWFTCLKIIQESQRLNLRMNLNLLKHHCSSSQYNNFYIGCTEMVQQKRSFCSKISIFNLNYLIFLIFSFKIENNGQV